MCGSPGLYAVFRHGKARGQHGVRLLKNIAHLHVLFCAAADDIVEILFDSSVDDEDNLLKACLHRVVERIVHDDLAVASDGVYLLEPAITAAHAGGHDNKSRFLHGRKSPYRFFMVIKNGSA
ncbi:hypothetical protein SDC9_131111 [bioreactor metagenome]|uniref:Uncharacterized protein n=1 Tax=bioreactor metagenome TaxID=1076179 RepID=A0A645D3H0_9ZZZZ